MKQALLGLLALFCGNSCSVSQESTPSNDAPEEVADESLADYSPLFSMGSPLNYQFLYKDKTSQVEALGHCLIDLVTLKQGADPHHPLQKSEIHCKGTDPKADAFLQNYLAGCWILNGDGLSYDAACKASVPCEKATQDSFCGDPKAGYNRAPLSKALVSKGQSRDLNGKVQPQIYRNEKGFLCYHQAKEESATTVLTYCFSDLHGIEEILIGDLSPDGYSAVFTWDDALRIDLPAKEAPLEEIPSGTGVLKKDQTAPDQKGEVKL